jgi:SAM-dependent methyltransferase/uncharacterized protein YbaR (Trm112 family)
MTGLWNLLRCPSCGDALELEPFSGRNPGAPDEGLLRSRCQLWFPVVRGIPRIFIGEMRSIYEKDFGDFLRRHGLGGQRTTTSNETELKLSTRESFGFEWTYFHEMLPQWSEAARFYFEPIGGLAALAGKLVLDGGCGKGRQAHYALTSGAHLVAVDFSRAIDVARDNCSDAPGERLFVQADLMSLPFAPETFDIACSFGVLHHLPDPEAGFRRLTAVVRPGGRVLVFVYHALEGEPIKQTILKAVTWARRLTTRLPHPILLPLTTVLGYGLYGGVVLPYKALSRIPLTREFAERLPLKAYARYPVRVIVNDQFDRFSAPIENRYCRDEVASWLERAELQWPSILGGHGWRALGYKASDVAIDSAAQTRSTSSGSIPG